MKITATSPTVLAQARRIAAENGLGDDAVEAIILGAEAKRLRIVGLTTHDWACRARADWNWMLQARRQRRLPGTRRQRRALISSITSRVIRVDRAYVQAACAACDSAVAFNNAAYALHADYWSQGPLREAAGELERAIARL